MPFGELNDLIACYQIFRGAKQKEEIDGWAMIPDLL